MTTEERILDVLREVIDPELGINIVDLGLVYSVEQQGDKFIVTVTATSAACPMAEEIVEDMERRLRTLPDVPTEVWFVLDPPWSPERMSASARDELGWAG